MTAAVVSGGELAAQIRADVTDRAAKLAESGTTPRLAVVTATDDEASAWYVRSIANAAAKAGIGCDIVLAGATDRRTDPRGPQPGAATRTLRHHPANPTSGRRFRGSASPGDAPRNPHTPTAAIPSAKDVDGANPLSLGRLAARLPTFAPATAAAVVRLLEHHGVDLTGRHAVVVGRSTVVGKPAAHLLLDRDATVTVCHSKTADLAAITRLGDILVAAAGRPGLITGEHVKPGAVVIDVGTNPTRTAAWPATSTRQPPKSLAPFPRYLAASAP